LGFKKKWYINSLVLTAGLRGGISYYVNGDYRGDNTLLGGGGDIVFGAEYYIKPEFSLFFKIAGRFFTNPVEGAGGDFELGGNASLGLLVAF
jgi:hypothetical protein